MATTTINIKTVQWSKNPLNINEATLLQVSVTKSVSDTVKCSITVLCDPTLLAGQNMTVETALIP
jgi:hypothetical protein